MSINWIYIIILGVFLVNVYIIKNEYKHKKIPNKLLLTLLGFNCLYFFVNPNSIYIIPTIIKLLLEVIWIILLYFSKIWNPSYLKYIFVSSLFFIWKWEIMFISNIFFIILVYIFLYFVYFYTKIMINPKRLKTYIMPLIKKTKWSIHNWVIKNKNYLSIKIVTVILWFFSVFIIIRIIRYYLQWELSFMSKVIEVNNITINTIVLIFILLFITSSILHKLYHKYLADNYKYLVIVITWTILFLVYEFMYDYEFISNYLHRILTFLLLLFFIIRIIVNMWKYLFFDSDSKIIHYEKLKTWDIVDIKLLWSYLLWQKSLENDNVLQFLKQIKNPINSEDCTTIIKIIKKNSDFQAKQWKTLPPNVIRVYNKFIFSPFIFWWFLITLFIWENLLISSIIVIFNKIIWFR